MDPESGKVAGPHGCSASHSPSHLLFNGAPGKAAGSPLALRTSRRSWLESLHTVSLIGHQEVCTLVPSYQKPMNFFIRNKAQNKTSVIKTAFLTQCCQSPGESRLRRRQERGSPVGCVSDDSRGLCTGNRAALTRSPEVNYCHLLPTQAC